MSTSTIPVILCGGCGTRLWSLSRKSFPKQAVSLVREKSRLQLFLERLGLLGPRVITIAAEDQCFMLADSLRLATLQGTIILAPIPRTTAATIALAAHHAAEDEYLLFCPADHHIPHAAAFTRAVKEGLIAARNSAIVTFGLFPSFLSTASGYHGRGAMREEGGLKACMPATGSCSTTRARDAAKCLSRARSRAASRTLPRGWKTACTWATSTPRVIGAMRKITCPCSGSCCSKTHQRTPSLGPACNTASGNSRVKRPGARCEASLRRARHFRSRRGDERREQQGSRHDAGPSGGADRPSHFRPTEVETLLGDPTKAKQKLGWEPEITVQGMCANMVASDLDEARRHALLKQHGYSVNVSVKYA